MDSQKNKKGTSVIEMEPSWNLLYYFGFQNFALAANLRDTIWGHVNPNVHKAAVYAVIWGGSLRVAWSIVWNSRWKQWNEEVKVAVPLAIYHVCHQAPSLFLTNCNREDNIEALNLWKRTDSPKNGFSYWADKLAALLITIYYVRFQKDACNWTGKFSSGHSCDVLMALCEVKI